MPAKFHLHIDRIPPEKKTIPKGTLAYQQKLWVGQKRSILLFDTENRVVRILNGRHRSANHFTFIVRGPAWFEKLDPECRVIVTYGDMVDFPANIIAACEGRVLGVEKKLIKNFGKFELTHNLGPTKKGKLARQLGLADFASVIHLQRTPKDINLEFLRAMHREPAG